MGLRNRAFVPVYYAIGARQEPHDAGTYRLTHRKALAPVPVDAASFYTRYSVSFSFLGLVRAVSGEKAEVRPAANAGTWLRAGLGCGEELLFIGRRGYAGRGQMTSHSPIMSGLVIFLGLC